MSKFAVELVVGIPTAETSRYPSFQDCYDTLRLPNNHIKISPHSQSPARNRNIIIEAALDKDARSILFLDDDIEFEPDLWERLAINNVDVVTGLMYRRNYPHTPLIFHEFDEYGRAFPRLLSTGENGLIPIVAAGLGCCLINTDVFREIDPPWIRLGETELDGWGDDIGFFYRMHKETQFKMFCDLNARVRHKAVVSVYPQVDANGRWLTTYDSLGSGTVSCYQEERQ